MSGNKVLAEINSEGQIRIKYIYALEKLIGFEYNKNRYFYERNIQGDILRIYQISDESSVLVVEYIYGV